MPTAIQLFHNDYVGVRDSGTLMSGIKLLAQRFVALLFTSGVQLLPDRGCSFVPRAQQAKNEYDIVTAFGFCKDTVAKQVNAASNGIPALTLHTVELLRVVVVDGTITLLLLIRNQLKATIKVSTPTLVVGYA